MDLDIIMQTNAYIVKLMEIVVLVCLYVDDMLILSDEMKGIIETKKFLSSTFKMIFEKLILS